MSVFDTLNPCPDCGSSDLDVLRHNDVSCRSCGSSAHITVWNRIRRFDDIESAESKLAVAEAEVKRLTRMIDGYPGAIVLSGDWEVRPHSSESIIMFRCGGYHRWLSLEEAENLRIELDGVLVAQQTKKGKT
jgi:hypothetical protein